MDMCRPLFSLTDNTTFKLIPIQIAETVIPRDFIIDKSKLKKNELTERFGWAGRQVFNQGVPTKDGEGKSQNAAMPPLPDGLDALIDFEDRMRELRLFILDLAMPRMKAIFLSRFHDCVKGGDYKDVKKFEDFMDIYRSGVYDNKRRGDLATICFEMWGRGQCFIEVEKLLMARLKLKYTDVLSNGNICKTRRKHGSIKSMLVRMKQTVFIDPIRIAGRDHYQEVVYMRHLTKPMEGVVDVVKVTVASHGYNGWLGLCVGHLQLLEKKVMPSPEFEVPGNGLLQYLQDMVKSGSTKTTAELLEDWQVKRKQKEMVVSVSTSSTTSPLTQDSSLTLVSPLNLPCKWSPGIYISLCVLFLQQQAAEDEGDDTTVDDTSTVGHFTVDLAHLGAKELVTPNIDLAPPEAQANKPTPSPVKAPNPRRGMGTSAKTKAFAKATGKPQAVSTPRTKRTSQAIKSTKNNNKRPADKSDAGPAKKRVARTAIQVAQPDTPTKRMENGRNLYSCQKHRLDTLESCEGAWFTKAQLEKENYPTACVGEQCKKLFTTAKKFDGKKYCKVNATLCAYVCRNALNHRDHECTFAYCNSCFSKKNLESTTTRTRKRVQRIQPGEKYGANVPS
jgi:hypothetical protein